VIEFDGRQKPPLDKNHIITGEIPIHPPPLTERAWDRLPNGLHLMGIEIREMAFYSESMPLETVMG
jgi:hypothetical protein